MAYASGKMLLFLILAALSGTLLVLVGLRWFSQRALFAAALVIVLVDLLPGATKFKVSQPADRILPESAVVDQLTGDGGLWRIAKFRSDVLPANLATLAGIDDVHGYDALNVRHYIEVLGALDSSLIDVSNAALRRRIGPIFSEEALDSKVLDLLNVKYVLSVDRGDASRPRIAAARGGASRPRIATRVNQDFLARAFLVETPRFLPTYEQVLAHMKTPDFDPRREVLLRGEGPGEPASGAEPGRAEIVKYDAADLEITADVRTRCYLVVSDVYYPGWRAFVDGVEAPILRADYAFRAVRLDVGRHAVRMTYRPPLFAVGLVFSTAGLALLAVMIASKRGWAAGGGHK